MPTGRALAWAVITIWSLAGLYVSFAFSTTLAWAWPNFVETPVWTQAFAWAVVLNPLVGLLAALLLRRTVPGRMMTIIVTSLITQVVALFSPLLLS